MRLGCRKAHASHRLFNAGANGCVQRTGLCYISNESRTHTQNSRVYRKVLDVRQFEALT